MTSSKIFTDRRGAGIELGRLLEVEYKDRHALVIGIPKGGVEVAYQVASILNGDLCTLVSRKLPYPDHTELTMGAIAEDGSVYLSSLAAHQPDDVVQQIINEQYQQVHRCASEYRKGKPFPSLYNRLVILVDDGIATGITLVPALRMCRTKGAAKIVVAVPVAADNYLSAIATLADEVKIVVQPDRFFSVGQFYEHFPEPTDEQIKGLLQRFNRKTVCAW